MIDEKTYEKLVTHYKVPEMKPKVQAWDELQNRIELLQPAPKTIRLGWTFWLSAVAAVFLALVIVYFHYDRTKVYTTELNTLVAQSQELILPDSSIVQLTSISSASIEYNSKTNETRVKLKGEALFQVTAGGDFRIEFDGGFVSVLGTQFTVSAYDESLVYVKCFEGLVKVGLYGQSFLLNEGQGIKMFNGIISGPFTIDIESANEQTEGIYYWNKISLDELLTFIGYRFDMRAEMDDELKNRKFSGKVELNNLDECLMIVSLAMDIDYSIDKEQGTLLFYEN